MFVAACCFDYCRYYSQILPSGVGHTTNCFISLRGTTENEPYIVSSSAPTQSQQTPDTTPASTPTTTTTTTTESVDAHADKRVIDDKSQRRPVKNIRQLAHALDPHSNEQHINSVQNLYWPVSLCPLLKTDVVIMDSPGLDMREVRILHWQTNILISQFFPL
jgi:hypothetical protein